MARNSLIHQILKNLFEHENFISNSEWTWIACKYSIETISSVVRNNLEFEQVQVVFVMQRNEPFHTMTLFVPALILTILAPIGLILPGKILQKCLYIMLQNIKSCKCIADLSIEMN